MSLIMEDFQPSVNTLEEVKKLQDLVRKLEIQNLHLRNEQNVSKKRPLSPVKEPKTSNRSPTRHLKKNLEGKARSDTCSNAGNIHLPSQDEYFDDLEVITVSDIEMSDEESWLYTSPKSQEQDRKVESLYKWLRKDVDDPENKPLQLAKRALLTKLNELEMLSSPSQVTSHAVQNPAISSSRKIQVLGGTHITAQNHDVHIDTRTFTRSKKRQALEFLEKLNSTEPDADQAELLLWRCSELDPNSISCHAVEDANDVQVVARMQEESLRMNSPLGTPKRGSLNNTLERKVSTSHESASDQDSSENSAFSVQSPDDYECVTVENSFQVELLHHSDQSSPSESPYSSNASLHNIEKVKLSGYMRSLPNLNRDPTLLKKSKNKNLAKNKMQNPNQVREKTSRRFDSNLQKPQKSQKVIPSSELKHSSNQVGEHSPIDIKATTTVPKSSDPVDSRLHVSSGLPRPSRANSASRSTPRSGIPMPSMLSRKRVEDSWSEGCF